MTKMSLAYENRVKEDLLSILFDAYLKAAPNTLQISGEVGRSKVLVLRLLTELEKKGYVSGKQAEKKRGVPRTWRLSNRIYEAYKKAKGGVNSS